MTSARSLRLALALPMVALWALAACSSETLAQKTARFCNARKSCPGFVGNCDETSIRQTLVAPAESAGCTKALEAWVDCGLANVCASYANLACTGELDAYYVCLVAKTCGNGACDSGETPGNCPSDCASS